MKRGWCALIRLASRMSASASVPTTSVSRSSMYRTISRVFAAAAAYFGQVRLSGIVGEDFPETFREELKSRDIDMAGLDILE